ncbi:hypothetical protein C0216_16895 [Streptomyces globosus]|uniref:Uncharacterized protein n=1 Tax=Streptomyces globosus TaxID=68209 RepID=A0A344U1Y4_9ACTN|nr:MULTISPECIES: hypothetical protein [Streptomyces]AXE24905.1 hypothetical protein C0216_16895 [Streptomyces globosus]
MKLRHARAVAVFGIVVFALTGARGSHGGSCGGGSSSSSSSSSGGSSSGGSSSSGSDGSDSSSSSGSVSGGAKSGDKAERDIRINECKMDASGKKLVARVTVTNSGSLDATYGFIVKWRGDSTASPAVASVTGLKVKAGASQTTEATTTYLGKGNGSEYKECVVSSATKNTF